MPSNYTGVPTAAEAPAAAPGYGVDVMLALPIDAEPANASSTEQPFKALADWAAWARDKLFTLRGIYAWLSSVTYNAGNVVIDNLDQHIYRALSTNGNMQPSSSPSVWSRIDWSAAEMASLTVRQYAAYGEATATNGAVVQQITRLSYNSDAMRKLDFQVWGVPTNSYTTIDLNPCADTKFATSCRSGQVSLLSGGWQYGGQVGLNIAVGGDHNKIIVWAKRGVGDSSTNFLVGVSLVGF